MSTVASIVANHPALTHTVKFLETTAGRDKALRVIQYWSRFFSYVLFRKGYSPQAVAQWKHLQAIVGLSRKLFRAGKPFSFAKSAAVAYENRTQDPLLRLTSVVRSLAYAVYMATDTVTWINVSGARKLARGPEITKLGLKFWLAGLVAGVINSLRKHQIASAKRAALLSEASAASANEKGTTTDQASLKRAQLDIKQAQKQLVWDLLDITIPVSGLQLVDGLDDGIVGAAGLITSLMGTKQQWAATA